MALKTGSLETLNRTFTVTFLPVKMEGPLAQCAQSHKSPVRKKGRSCRVHCLFFSLFYVCNFISYNFIMLRSLKLHGTQCGIDRLKVQRYKTNEPGKKICRWSIH